MNASDDLFQQYGKKKPFDIWRKDNEITFGKVIKIGAEKVDVNWENGMESMKS